LLGDDLQRLGRVLAAIILADWLNRIIRVLLDGSEMRLVLR